MRETAQRHTRKALEEAHKLRLEMVKQMVILATAGFGLVAALSWNAAVQALFNDIVRPKLSIGTGVISLFLYAILITLIAVFVTMQLTRLARDQEKKEEKIPSNEEV